ncbi:hypothetical protein M011DRAFT_465750 [Sporormia fimetaria CBS 119925]|uniref:Eisosome protein 1 n=1 Tax=Sporormia fimetaria CBS 119925 TaxID=1340428 RepID=A0A6A6VFC0_9PLEO|nr:hypothetical protein M011DRAFT_465750 [Sporormia fimetaria CBS 119925]
MRCPDPSAHKPKDTSLQDHASATAMRTDTTPRDAKRRDTLNPLGPDGKLSSASAATSLRHAQAQDLPSFPSVGIDTRSSAGAAATLANSNTRSPEWWTPGQSSAAGKAAMLAKDYKMEPLWQPEASAAGSKAALLAHQGGPNLNLWAPAPSSAGHSAATMAFSRQRQTAETATGHGDNMSRRALAGATGAVTSTSRPRASSTPNAPESYPDSANLGRNALNAATIAHRPSVKSPASAAPDHQKLDALEAARIQHAKISREMYTSTPPVAIEVEEKRRQDALRASAVSMAKQMYDVQQHNLQPGVSARSEAQAGAAMAQGTHGKGEGADIREQAMRYIGIQEAAQKLANERLAKIGFDENAAYRSYYGYEKPRNRLSLRLGRNRSSSEPGRADDSDDDDLRTRRIRSQMSQFNRQLAEVDAKKREEDRRYLLAAAQRKVQAQMEGLDKKIFDETGHMSPAMMEEWDAQARAKAAAASEQRLENHGKVHIGHGKFIDQADIDAVARARIQPTLDEINEKTEKRRAEEEERRLDLEEKKREQRMEKERAAEIKAEQKRHKGKHGRHWKRFRRKTDERFRSTPNAVYAAIRMRVYYPRR